MRKRFVPFMVFSAWGRNHLHRHHPNISMSSFDTAGYRDCYFC